MLGPILFIIYINDIDFLCALISVLKIFADDTKLAQKILNESDKNILQNRLNKLCDWAETWGMMFNVDKCKVMHIGIRNPCYTFTFTMNNQTLSEKRYRSYYACKLETFSALQPISSKSKWYIITYL